MKIQEEYLDQSKGISYYKIYFEVIMKAKITADQWYEINHKIEELIQEAQNKKK
jgi:hypothetical protein